MKILTNLDLSQNEIQNAIMQPLAAPPSNPKIGQIYFNSIDLTLYLWTGEKWIPVPTKLSQLENDSKFITAKDVPEGAVASTTTPKMNGTAAVGSETAFARGDHVHPKDTSKLNTDGDGSNVTVAFEAAAKREAPVSGEKLSVLLGKVLKFFSLLTARRRTANTVPHHPRKAYPSRSRGRLTGPVMGKHKTADAPGGARKAWPELYTAGRLFNGEYRKQHHRALQSIPQNPLRKARQPDRHALPHGGHRAHRRPL